MKFLPQDVRRATLDDLPQLIELWRLKKLPGGGMGMTALNL